MRLSVDGQEIKDGGTLNVKQLKDVTFTLGWQDPEQSITLFVNGKPVMPGPANGLINRSATSTAHFPLNDGPNRLSYLVYTKANSINKSGGAMFGFTVKVVTAEPEKPQQNEPSRKVVRGTIIESSDPAVAKLAKDCGFTLWRDWCSVNWNTGKINDAKDIANVNKKVKDGWQVILTVTVDEQKNRKGEMCPDFSTVADQLIKGGLDKSVIVQLVNEANLPAYWPEGDVEQATKAFAVPVGVKLKAAGYKLACPSITWGTPKTIEAWVDGIFANSPAGLWDYIDGHSYLPDIKAFENVAKCYSALAAKHKAVAISTEWSRKEGWELFATHVDDYFAIADTYYAIHCWFSFTYGAKFNPLNPYAYRDGKTNAVYDAIKKYISQK